MIAILARLLLVLTLAAAGAGTATAQEVALPDYGAWDTLAREVEGQLDAPDTTDGTLESYRADLVAWRAQFLDAQSLNGARIDTLRAQIAALGEPPAEGATEPDDIAKRRADLTEALDAALAPVRAAEEAYTRADGLVGEIDDTLVARQTETLTALGPSPLNPTAWGPAIGALSATLATAWRTVAANSADEAARAGLWHNAGVIALYLMAAIVLVARGRRWSERFTAAVRERAKGQSGKGVSGFVASLSQIAVPVLGLFAFAEAAQVSGLLGPRGVVLIEAVPQIGLAYFASRWIVGRLFYPTGSGAPLLDLEGARRRELVGQATLLGITWALHQVLVQLSVLDGFAPATEAVLGLPLLVLGGVSLFRLAVILRAAAQPPAVGEDDDDPAAGQGFAALITRTLTRGLRIVAVGAVVLGLVGFTAAAEAALYPAILSLALIGVLIILSRLATDLYGLASRKEDGGRDDLIPVLAAFALIVVSLPVFALIWGVREGQLWEIWARMRAGVSVGDARISVTDFLTFVIMFVVGLAVTRLIKSALSTAVLPKTQLDKGGQNAVVAGAGYVGVFLSAIIAITAAGIDLSALAIVAGALSVGIGFGLQNIVQNFVSGIILLIERPISEGDWIEVGGQMGFVRDISVRSTRVETFDRTDVIVPNADLISGQVTNYTRGNLLGRVVVPVGVAYGTDTRQVSDILMEIARAHPMVTLNPPPQVYFLNFGADALEFEIRAILRDVTFVMQVKNDINHEIAKKFGEAGIEIPFAQRDIWLRNPEALTGRTRAVDVKGAKIELEDDFGTPEAEPGEGETE